MSCLCRVCRPFAFTLTLADYTAIDTQLATDSSTKHDCEVLRRPADATFWTVIEGSFLRSLVDARATQPANDFP